VDHGHAAFGDEEEGKIESMVVVADELSCPICFKLMTDPVMAEDGHTYERQAIEQWIDKCITGTGFGYHLVTYILAKRFAIMFTWGGQCNTRLRNDVLTSSTHVLYGLMAEGRPVTSPLTGVEMGSSLKPNFLVRSLVGRMA
jgi:hypothetical protein